MEIDNNKNEIEDLLCVVETCQERLAILIAVCDCDNRRSQIIAECNNRLPQIKFCQAWLDLDDPSTTQAIRSTFQENQLNLAIHILGAEKLSSSKRGEKRSQKEEFFGYLQWTREAFRNFKHPIILWVTEQTMVEMIKKAPDFWSWRKSVFRFNVG